MKEPESKTSFESKCDILSDLWINYRFDKRFEDFLNYNDIGLPLGFLVSEDLVKPALMAKSMIEESFDVLLAALKIEEDTGFDSLDDMFVG
jgi:hypothetical protein